MLKKIIILLTFICAFNLNSQVNGIAIYKKKISITKSKIDSNKNINEQIKSSLNSIEKIVGNFEYHLEFNDTYAKYFENSGLSIENDDTTAIGIAKAIIGLDGEYYYDITNNKLINETTGYGEKILVDRSISKDVWKLSRESKLIDGELCYKATRLQQVNTRRGKKNIEIIAWYNPKLNIPIGPDGNYGLPGLIVVLENNNVTTYLNNIKRLEEPPKINFPVKGKTMSESEYDEYVLEIISKVRDYK